MSTNSFVVRLRENPTNQTIVVAVEYRPDKKIKLTRSQKHSNTILKFNVTCRAHHTRITIFDFFHTYVVKHAPHAPMVPSQKKEIALELTRAESVNDNLRPVQISIGEDSWWFNVKLKSGWYLQVNSALLKEASKVFLEYIYNQQSTDFKAISQKFCEDLKQFERHRIAIGYITHMIDSLDLELDFPVLERIEQNGYYGIFNLSVIEPSRVCDVVWPLAAPFVDTAVQ